MESTREADLLGFISIERTNDSEGYIGALMVTDYRGYPQEFRATTAVRPTLVQKALYGSQLDHYVGIQLCARNLIQQVQRKPVVYLVASVELLDLAAEVGPDVLAIWVPGESIARSTAGTDLKSKAGNRPLVYEARIAERADESRIIGFVESCATSFDLIEAFERMKNALHLLGQEDKKFS
jgi:hypothetical protein